MSGWLRGSITTPRVFLLCLIAAASCDRPQLHIKHVDGDTVWIDGVKYRLHGIDSPEPSHMAKCEAERELGLRASAFVKEITHGATLEVTREYGMSFDRRVADISINGRDWGEWIVAEGFAAT